MTIQQLKDSKWGQQARRPGARRRVGRQFHRWISVVAHLGLIARARELWAYLHSNAISRADKLLVVAALLYLIAPIDLIPDFIPLAGWLDDLGVAAMVIRHITHKLNEHAARTSDMPAGS